MHNCTNCKRTTVVSDKCAWAHVHLSQQLFTVLCVYHKTRYSSVYSPSALGVIDPEPGVAGELSRHNASLFETRLARDCLLNIHCWVL